MCDLMSSTSSYTNAQNLINQTKNIISNANATAATNSAMIVNANLAFNNPKGAKLLADFKQIILELRAQNFDVIRFATYRTASKLRFIQKKLNLHLIDLWNVIETFRDNNFQTLDLMNELELNKVESCIKNMYLQLNKRLALNQHINVDSQTQLLLAWLFGLYDKNRLAKIRLFSLKVALTTMCSGKLIDKLKYIFNQISDQNKNVLNIQKFDSYLRELLVLPKSIFEEPSFGYNENIAKTCFDLNSPIRLEDFLNVALSDVGPPCFIWLNIFHRFINVQSVIHPVTCSVCERTNFIGFRYKCQKCRKYQLCQDCFWRGRISHSHQLTHQMKEYISYKSTAKQISNSLKRSFFCKPSKSGSSQNNQMPKQHSSNNSYSQQQQCQDPPPQNLQLQQQQPSSSTSRHHNKYGEMTTTQRATPITLLGLTNNSDYNMVFSRDKSSIDAAAKLQTQTLNNISTTTNANAGVNGGIGTNLPTTSSLPLNTDIYSKPMFNSSTMTMASTASNTTATAMANATTAAKSNKKVLTQNIPGSSTNIDDGFCFNDSNHKFVQQPLDLTHIIPSTNDLKAINQNDYMTQSMTKSNANYSNTLSMTRSKHNDNHHLTSPLNLFASFILSNSNQTGTAPQQQSMSCDNSNHQLAQSVLPTNNEEHNIIAHYCSRLADFYTKNPHLSPSPTANTPSPPNLPPPPPPPPPAPSSSQQQSSFTSLLIGGGKSNSSTLPHSSSSSILNPKQQSQSKSKAASKFNYEIENNFPTAAMRTSSLSRQQTLDSSSNRLKYPTNTYSTHVNYLANNATSGMNQRSTLTRPVSTATTRSLSESNFKLTGTSHHHQQQQHNYAELISREDQINTIEDKLLKEKREIVAKLEKQNREIMKEIKRLRQKQMSNQSLEYTNCVGGDVALADSQYYRQKLMQQQQLQQLQQQQFIKNYQNIYNAATSKSRETTPSFSKQATTKTLTRLQQQIDPGLIAELRTLKVKKGELETRMQTLINSRDELIDRLAQLDSLIKTSNQQQPTQSPVHGYQSVCVPAVSASAALQMPSMLHRNGGSSVPPSTAGRSWSTPSTPAVYEFHPTSRPQAAYQQSSQQSLSSANQSNQSSSSNLRALRNDLLIAADSVTNAMQSLVKELNSENGEPAGENNYQPQQNGHHFNNTNGEECDDADSVDDDDDYFTNRTFNLTSMTNGTAKVAYSQSASATPVTYRKNYVPLNNVCSTNSLNRNAMNLDDSSIDYLANFDNPEIRLISNQIMSDFSTSATNNSNHNYEHFHGQTSLNGNGHTNGHDDEEDDEDDANLEENLLYQNYLLTESYIDELNNGASKQGHNNSQKSSMLESDQQQQQQQLEHELNQLNDEDLANLLANGSTKCDSTTVANGGDNREHGENSLLRNLIDDNEQIASWTRELEQVLIEDQTNENNENHNNQPLTNGHSSILTSKEN